MFPGSLLKHLMYYRYGRKNYSCQCSASRTNAQRRRDSPTSRDVSTTASYNATNRSSFSSPSSIGRLGLQKTTLKSLVCTTSNVKSPLLILATYKAQVPSQVSPVQVSGRKSVTQPVPHVAVAVFDFIVLVPRLGNKFHTIDRKMVGFPMVSIMFYVLRKSPQ